MYTNLAIPRQWSRLACLCRSLTSVEGQKLPQAGKSSDGISPPPRIPRGPTDILQALAATVGTDPTAAHYKYHDDPYLIPLSNFRKRSYALSAEAGKKAAAWVRDQHPELFTTREWDPPMKMKTPYFNADPHIEAFAPKPIYNDESKVTEEDLVYTIKNALLEDAVKVFELLGGVDNVNEELKLYLLQLICLYNEKEPISNEWIEERWFSTAVKERQSTTWKLGGLADKIFTSMDPKTPEAYCSLIQGMAKYYQAERAYALSREALENNIPLSTDVYNSLLVCIGFLKEGVTLRVEALLELLNEMNQQGITPNTGTLTACLRSLSAWGGGKTLQNMALQIIAEFKNIGIEPNLSAYYYLLCLFCKERGPRIDILSGILTELEKKDSLEPEDIVDTSFFITAMSVCSEHLQDMNLAERVHELLMKGDNYKLVGDAYKESIYYRHLVTVACRHAPFEKTMGLLDTLIPNIYVPEPTVMEEIIKVLELGGAGERLSESWSQLVVFGHARRLRLVERLLEAMCACISYQDEEVKAKIRKSAADMLKFYQMAEERNENVSTRTPVQKLSAAALSNIIDLCSTGEEPESWEAIQLAVNELGSASGAGRADVISAVATTAAKKGQHALAASALTYLAECGFPEAMSASVDTLSVMLNRSTEEVETILQGTDLEGKLQESAMAVVQAYRMSKAGEPLRERDSSASSSDSESSSDEE
ncbi:small ribosomal subunit protein mS39 [Danaus plexippus]|uniref:small ribosomal subunit protein mS39 n=1 Tax=Danaus plexippus TaxID=13037 RepID=UPI002AAFFDED|nr:small ribosomal subunit protein mS39 [Danaus plexippus]